MTFMPPPPSRIILMRHARSGWALPGQTDFKRSLDEAGLKEAAAVSELAATGGYRPDLVLCSTALRCRQTADAFLATFTEPPDVIYADELYNAPPAAYFDLLGEHPDRAAIMLLGHNPAMEEMLEALAGRGAAAEVIPDGYPTAGFAVLTHAGDLAEDKWFLSAFLKS